MPQGASKLGGKGRGRSGKGHRNKKQMNKRGKRENKKGRVFRPSKFKQGKMAKRKAQHKLTATINRNIEALMAAKVLASGTNLSTGSLSRVGARQINIERAEREKRAKRAMSKIGLAEKALANHDARRNRDSAKAGVGASAGRGNNPKSGLAAKLLGNLPPRDR